MAGKSKMKQTMDIAEQLKIAEDNAEDSGEGDYSKILPPKNKSESTVKEGKEEIPKEEPKDSTKVTVKTEEKKPATKFKTVTTEPVIKEEARPSSNVMSKEYIKKVIMITDTYRSYDESIKGVIKKFIKAESEDIEEIIFKSLSTNKTEVNALIDLVDLKREDGTSRAFSLMSYDDERLTQVSNLLAIFNSDYNIADTDNKIEFCRNLEKGISSLKEESLEYLDPVRELLILVI